jgi:hypothetical protein
MRARWVIGFAAGLGLCMAVGAATNAAPSPNLVPASVLAFDADLKQFDAVTTNQNATFTFWVTNVCATNVLILEAETSCGCAAVQLPARPWVLQPLDFGPISVVLDLRGRRGIVLKAVQLTSSAGVKALVVRANMPEPLGPPPGLKAVATQTNQGPPSAKTTPPLRPKRW